MALDRRAYNGTKDYIPVKGEAAASWQPVKPATIQERRIMKKGAQPEYSYTGCVPYTADEPDDVPKKKNPPILGYRGHLRNQDDRVGTTFTQGLTVASRGPEPLLTRSDTKTQRPINQQHQVRFAEDKHRSSKPLAVVGAKGMSPRSGYGQFDNASGYGAFAPPPPAGGMSPRSGYGAFDNTSGYGCFASPPERDTGISPRSGYGAFDNASGYGNFAAPPDAMSPRSGYGAFDNASGYGNFAMSPEQGGMSPRSGYGAFDNASGYGNFAAPPVRGGMSPRPGYGAFDNTNGYGNFASPANETTVDTLTQSREMQTPGDRVLNAKYQLAIMRIGGEQASQRLWSVAAQAVWQRYMMRTELLQAVKRSFEKHERTSHGFMTKAQLKEAMRDLGCVFTDDQITALFGTHDQQCNGTVPMSEFLIAFTKEL